ncbi:MAG: gliding motility protein GldN [Sediminibacterium sp. Gen4]|jgi:gliding motility associated protien GldN|uniref:type IX secretion system ring protein PorN/GldN n=1 Tax=unclassified Sediminibacterium TaxID=2635961 RepID=UPI0015B95CCA|nr:MULTISPECIES: gliding motility protein GldN [unclassified Sediminibacterium]MBW0160137.1 gliding motility protein GldN [Sediminibacterium sp.]MBW0163612.1 gliding motility protein GldN [Sediminibacterium sp.]NWK66463.1 gliding motility protein GldN [Sediminibacterium sp. Gen4]
MKKTFLLCLTVSLLAGTTAMAQFNLTRNRPKNAADSAAAAKRDTTKPATTTNANKPAVDPASIKPSKTVDTTIVGGFGEVVPRSLRNETAADRSQTREKRPLEYEHLREDDWLFSEFIWREIDAREKVNQPFMYPGKDDLGDQRFFSILLSAIKNDSVVPFSAEGGDDRFTKPMSYDDITKMLKGRLDTQLVQNADNPNVVDTAVIYDTKFAPNPDSIYTFRLKEQWIFDKEASRMFVRIIGIAPVAKLVINGKSTPRTLFWIYYPDLRKTLTKYNVYNTKNYAGRMTWEELFESRFFGSYIVKTSSNNPSDRFLSALIRDPLFRLLEGENIKERLFNYEQDLWQY